jgi:outer membrane protein assembly factor BamB
MSKKQLDFRFYFTNLALSLNRKMIVNTATNVNNVAMKGQVMLKVKNHKRLVFQWFLFYFSVSVSLCTILEAGGKDFFYLDTQDVGQPDPQVPLIQPWKIVRLDPDYGGQWILAADLNADGEVDILSSENFNKGDVHYTATAVAQNLDGSVLWKWGNPNIGRKNWHHDVACQIHDFNGDNKYEVVLCTKGFLVELEGATGHELRRIPIPDEATDCLVFCNLSGNGHPTDVLVKDRYHNIWAYNRQGKLLWTVKDPGGFLTAHQPLPIDLDGDGRDEIMAGYAMLNSDGSVRWVYKSKQVDQAKGHLDCARVFRQGPSPEDFRIVLTCCGANNIALIDGNGKVLWEISGHHFESIDVGRIIPNHIGEHICVDIDHQPYGRSPVWVLDEEGRHLGRLITDYSRHHCLLDFTGDGIEEIMVAHKGGLYNYQGHRIGTFNTPGEEIYQEKVKYEKSMLTGDMTGDGILDVILATPYNVYIYKNTKGKKPGKPSRLGTEPNFTLY